MVVRNLMMLMRRRRMNFMIIFMVEETMVKKEWLCPIKCVKNNSNDFISNINESVDVTLATDDDKQLKAHNKSFTNQ